MPTYQYACRSCAHRFDAVQGFHEDALTTCPECAQDNLRKLFGNVGVVFKGSGFYRNDSRSEAKSGAANRTKPTVDAKSADSGSSGSDSSSAGSDKAASPSKSESAAPSTPASSSPTPASSPAVA